MTQTRQTAPPGGNGCSPANGGPGLGSIDPAITVAPNATFNIDAVVDEIDPADGLSGYGFRHPQQHPQPLLRLRREGS